MGKSSYNKLMNVDDDTRKNIETKHNKDPDKCICEVIEKWSNDKNSFNYQYTWSGICELLDNLERNTQTLQLEEALAADISSFNQHIQVKI